MRSHRKLLLSIAVLGLVLAGYGAWRWHQPEAKLRRQVEHLVKVLTDNNGSAAFTSASGAVLKLETNAIPILVDLVDEDKRNAVSDYHWIYQKLPTFYQSRMEQPVDPKKFREQAAAALEFTLTEKPIPELLPRLLEHRNARLREGGAKVLFMDLIMERKLQPEKLYASLNSDDPIVLTTVLLALTQAGPEAHPAKAAVAKLLVHPDELVRYNAACATLCIGGPTNLAKMAFETLTKSHEMGEMAADQLSALRYPSDRPGSPHPGNFRMFGFERIFDQRKVHPQIRIGWH